MKDDVLLDTVAPLDALASYAALNVASLPALQKPTPRGNAGLPRKLGGFSTLWEGLDYAARGETGFNFYSNRGALEHVLPHRRLRRQALTAAGKLVAAGLKRGDRVGLIAETSPSFMRVFFGCQYAGLIPCPMPAPQQIGGAQALSNRIAGMMRAARMQAVVMGEGHRDIVAPAAEKAGVSMVLSHDALDALSASGSEPQPSGPGDIAYIQYSSGSISAPKGVLISQAAVCANTSAILRHGMRLRPDDRAFSWLPLYHDMGLVGFCLSPVMGQISCDFLSPSAFSRRPALWLKLMSQNGATISYAPSTGFGLAARRVNGEARQLDLSRWRIAGVGGDMVRPNDLTDFAEKMTVAGFDARAFKPSYGMAEFTLAMTFSDDDAPYQVDVIDYEQAGMTGRAVPVKDQTGDGRAFVSCGAPLPGHEIKITDNHGNPLREREIGHILARGPSLMSGYYGDEEATAAVMHEDGFMDTGDMGYWLNGRLIVTGRAKDLVIVHGRNIWPQDIEWAVEEAAGLRHGDVAAFTGKSRQSGESVIVLVHCRCENASQAGALRRKARKAVHQVAGIECEVALVKPQSLPFTSSGKLSRAKARKLYLAGKMTTVFATETVS